MVKVFNYSLQRLLIEVEGSSLFKTKNGAIIPRTPAVSWSTGELWIEASTYLAEKAWYQASTGSSHLTVINHASSLCIFANFIEENGDLHWTNFPNDKSSRPTYRFRGHVLNKVTAGDIARSTAARHMSVIKQFYSWAKYHNLIEIGAEPFLTKNVSVKITNKFGVMSSMSIISSDLAIKGGQAQNRGVEDGAHPIRLSERDQLLKIGSGTFRQEFNLVLKIGFFTGMRIGTIIGLTYKALRHHVRSQDIEGWFRIEVGGNTGIPTKRGVHYWPSIPPPLMDELLDYCKRPRRLIRVKSALPDDRDLLFLNRYGQRLNNSSYSADMTLLRKLSSAQGMHLPNFHFHCTRATFGTAVVLSMMDANIPEKFILSRLMACMGHTQAQSSLSYIRFIENEKHMAEDAELYAKYLRLP